MEHLSLLPDGQDHDPSQARAAWEKAAADVLRKSGRMKVEDPDALVWQKLTRTTLDGVEVAPLGTAASLEDVPDPGAPGAAPYTRGSAPARSEARWDVRSLVADPDPALAAEAALNDLENGVTSLWLTLGRRGVPVEALPQVLEKVYLDLAPVVLDADDAVAGAEALAALLAERDVRPAAGTTLAGDLFAHADGEASPTAVTRLAELAREHVTLALTVDGTHVHDAGATDAQELGYSLAAGVAYLRLLTEHAGLSVEEAAGLLLFRYAATDEQFPTIAKFRAARRLWHQVLVHAGAPGAPGQVQHAVTSRPMITKYDPYVNILRGTVAAFAAGVGGADAVTVLPFDDAIGLPDEFSRRNARNTSLLLIEESHVARVADPAGGSYAVERLTDDLAHAGWAQFQRIEAEGGIAASLAAQDGGLHDRIKDQALMPRLRQIATRRRPITGVSEFPNLEETLPERRPHPEGAVEVNRYATAYELLRDEPAPAPVFLATLGPVAHHTARATFAANLLAAGGVDTVAAGATSGTEELLAAFEAQGSLPVVCLCGTDTAYAEWGAEAAAALRKAGARHVILAGKPREGLAVDDSCAVGVDALAFLGRVREELGK